MRIILISLLAICGFNLEILGAQIPDSDSGNSLELEDSPEHVDSPELENSSESTNTSAHNLAPFTAKQIEFHGIYNDKPFWVRLLPADKRFGGARILELLYTPYNKNRLAGAVLVDHPQILLDKQLRVIAWKEGRGVQQSGLGNVMYRADLKPARYNVTREIDDADGETDSDERAIPGAAGCDLQILPILLACAYSAEHQQADLRVVDLFGGDHREKMIAQLRTGSCTFGKRQWKITTDTEGHIQTIHDQTGAVLIQVEAFLKK